MKSKKKMDWTQKANDKEQQHAYRFIDTPKKYPSNWFLYRNSLSPLVIECSLLFTIYRIFVHKFVYLLHDVVCGDFKMVSAISA